MSEKQSLMLAIQQQGMVLYDIVLFLDTHPDDRAALEKYREVLRRYEDLTEGYAEKYGPLTFRDADCRNEWEWIKGPWPWEGCANVDI